MTRQDYQCPHCHKIEEYQVHLGQDVHLHCPDCGALMRRYFGRMTGEDMLTNFGYREHRYSNETDARIAQFQFKNL